MYFLYDAVIFLGAAMIAVPIAKKLGLGSILGYLFAGVIIGPWGLGLIGGSAYGEGGQSADEVEDILHMAELGVVLLLFIIGLELQPKRLWTMRAPVFGLGGSQMVITAALITGVALWAGVEFGPAVVIGLALALSSTAFVLQTLAEKHQMATHHGRKAFSILLFQDMAVIPILAVVPLLAATGDGPAFSFDLAFWIAVGKVVAVLAAVGIIGHYALRPIMRFVAELEVPELFTGLSLLIVVGTSTAMMAVDISPALGAFMAGVLLADSEYRHELEADINPFKGLLLGLFFISVGMSLNMGLLVSMPVIIILATLGLMLLKGAILYGLGRLFKLSRLGGVSLGASLCQGGEFAYVVFTAAITAGVMTQAQTDMLVVVVTLSMALTPLCFIGADLLNKKLTDKGGDDSYDIMPEQVPQVIIAGFGRFGQIAGRVLTAKHIPFTAIEKDADQVNFVAKFGNKIYYGDAGREEILRAAHAEQAVALVLAVDDVEASVEIADTVRKHFPDLKIYARARNRQHAYQLMDLGVYTFRRETFLSSLDLTRELLEGLGLTEHDAMHTVSVFRDHDRHRLFADHGKQGDQEHMQRSAMEAAKELEEMFERDAEELKELNTADANKGSEKFFAESARHDGHPPERKDAAE